MAARRAAQTPLAEVLAIVGKQPVAVLAYPGARSAYGLSRVEARSRIGSDRDRATAGEISERYLFHRSSAKPVAESRVMHDFAIADIDSVVQITTTRRDNV
jgi:hypothetical protein